MSNNSIWSNPEDKHTAMTIKSFRLPHLLVLVLSCLLCSSCITEDNDGNTHSGNLHALWKIIDEHYCFLDYKQQEYGLDWNEIYNQYNQYLVPDMSEKQFFEVCGNMLAELKDGHVNLTSSYDMARYWDWFEQYPANFSDSIQRKYLGTDYMVTQGIKYRILENNIGYIYCPSFDYSFGSGNLSAIFANLAICTGIVVDVRNNSGGMLTSAQALAECFIDGETVGGYICHKTGKGHSDFSTPKAIKLTPSTGIRWHKPVAILTNRRSYSATNTFVMYMKACTQAKIIGDHTGGGCGMPFSSELPNGWTVRFSACPMYDINMNLTENGIAPDIKVDISTSDWQKGTDTILETAFRYLIGKP